MTSNDDTHSALLRQAFPSGLGRDGPLCDALCLYQYAWEILFETRLASGDRSTRSYWRPEDVPWARWLLITGRRRLFSLSSVHGLAPRALSYRLRLVRDSVAAEMVPPPRGARLGSGRSRPVVIQWAMDAPAPSPLPHSFGLDFDRRRFCCQSEWQAFVRSLVADWHDGDYFCRAVEGYMEAWLRIDRHHRQHGRSRQRADFPPIRWDLRRWVILLNRFRRPRSLGEVQHVKRAVRRWLVVTAAIDPRLVTGWDYRAPPHPPEG